MQLQLVKSKIHRARITAVELEYEGSLKIDRDLLDMVGIFPYEKILVVNITNGQRFETYAIEGERGSGVFSVNGAAARRAYVGDLVTIMSFGVVEQAEAGNVVPRVIVLNEQNDVIERKGM